MEISNLYYMSGIFNNAEKYRNTGIVTGTDEIGERGPPGVGFTLTSDGNYDMDNKILTNAKDPSSDKDVVTKKYMEKYVAESHVTSSEKRNVFDYVMTDHKNAITPEFNLTIADNLVDLQSSPFEYNKNVLSAEVEKDALDVYSSGMEIKVPTIPGDYTMAFNLIWTSDSVDAGKTELSVTSVGTVYLIRQHKNIFGDRKYVKMVAQFNTDVNSQEIELDFKVFFKSGIAKPTKLKVYFVCYGIRGLQYDVPADVYNNYNARFLHLDGSKAMAGNLDLGNNKVINSAAPTDDGDLTTKKYVDDADAEFLKTDGSRSISANLRMDGHIITQHGIGTNDTDLVNKSYIDVADAAKPNIDDVLLRDGSQEMKGNLDIGNFLIKNVKDPVSDQDAVNKQYTDTQIKESHVTSSDKADSFKYIMNDPASQLTPAGVEFGGIVKYDPSPHSINKNVVDCKIKLDTSKGYYDSIIRVNLHPLQNGDYTMAFELIWTIDGIDKDSINLSGFSSKEAIHKVSQKVLTNMSE